jgi:1,2-phenylacetyl-CoA epoxidase PaaB subunit
MQTYEVYAEDANARVEHVGSVRSYNTRLALHAAREIFFRRSACRRLAVRVGEELVWSDLPEHELTTRNAQRSYRLPAFFVQQRYRQTDDA